MTKKLYEKPSLKVYELKQPCRLLAGSSITGDRGTPYGAPVPYE